MKKMGWVRVIQPADKTNQDTPSQYLISKYLGEFADRQIEANFRAETESTDCRLGARNMLILAVMFFSFVVADIEVFHDALHLIHDFLARGAVLVTGIVIFFVLRRHPKALVFDRSVLVFAMVAIVMLFIIIDDYNTVSNRPPSTFDVLTVYLISTLISFVILPNRLVVQVSVVAALVGSYIGLAAWSMPPDDVGHIYAGVYLSNVVLIGYFTSYRLHTSRRESWVHLMLEREATAMLEAEIEERQALEAELRYLATTDPLTNTSSRRHFLEQAKAEIERCQRYGRELTILSLDLDNFKRINDTHGHAIGDLALVEAVNAMRTVLRGSDLLGRLGGEEFAILLPETGAKSSADVAERARALVAAAKVEAGGSMVPMTVSIGGATLHTADGEGLERLMARADKALYSAKRGGRNRVVFWSSANTLNDLNLDGTRTIN